MAEHDLDPLFREVAQSQEAHRRSREQERARRSAERFANDQCDKAWELVLRQQRSSDGMTEGESLEWAGRVRSAVEASNGAGKKSQLDKLAEYADKEGISTDCRLAARVLRMVMDGQPDSIVALHLRSLPYVDSLFSGFEWAAENLRIGGPFPQRDDQRQAPPSPPPQASDLMTREEISIVSRIAIQTLKNQSNRYLGEPTVNPGAGRGKKKQWRYTEIRKRLEEATQGPMPSLEEAQLILRTRGNV